MLIASSRFALKSLDALDVRIFCEMAFKYNDYNRYSERHVSPADIGKKFGLDEKTVRLRVRKMESDGFIKYYQAMPNLKLLGFNEICSCILEAPTVPSKHEAIEQFRKARLVVEIDDFLGPLFGVAISGESLEEAENAVGELASKIGVKVHPNMIERKIRAPTIQPKRLDWQIIKELRYDALRETKDIADSLHVTYRMVEYRISNLLDSGVFFVVALINPQNQQGVIFYGLNLIVDPAKQSILLNRLRQMQGQKLWYVSTPDNQTIAAGLFSLTSGEPEDAQLAASKMDGVKQCFLVLHRERFEPDRPNWIDAWIETKVEG